MSFTYTTPWATSRDYVRFLIADTVTTNHQFEDEELDSLLSQWGGDARMAAAEALDALAGLYARGAIRYSVTGFSMDRTETARAMRLHAQELRDEAKNVPFEFESILDEFIDSAGQDWSNYPDTQP